MHKEHLRPAAALCAAAIILLAFASASAFWLMDGNALCKDPARQTLMQCISDGSGGLIAMWLDDRVYENNIGIQRVDADGALSYDEDGYLPSDFLYTVNQRSP